MNLRHFDLEQLSNLCLSSLWQYLSSNLWPATLQLGQRGRQKTIRLWPNSALRSLRELRTSSAEVPQPFPPQWPRSGKIKLESVPTIHKMERKQVWDKASRSWIENGSQTVVLISFWLHQQSNAEEQLVCGLIWSCVGCATFAPWVRRFRNLFRRSYPALAKSN